METLGTTLLAAAVASLAVSACSDSKERVVEAEAQVAPPATLADYAKAGALARAPDNRQARVVAVAETPDHKAACGLLRVGGDEDIPFLIELNQPYAPGETTPPQVAAGEGATPRSAPYLAERAKQYAARCAELGLDLATLPRSGD